MECRSGAMPMLQLKGAGRSSLPGKSPGKCWVLGWKASNVRFIWSLLRACCLSPMCWFGSINKLMSCFLYHAFLPLSALLLSLETNVSHANPLNCWQQSNKIYGLRKFFPPLTRFWSTCFHLQELQKKVKKQAQSLSFTWACQLMQTCSVSYSPKITLEATCKL